MVQLISLDKQRRIIEGGRKGGLTLKHFTPESKERQREGARRGGSSPKHFTLESKNRQITGAIKGGRHSHLHDVQDLISHQAQQAILDGASKGGKIGGKQPKHFTEESKLRQIEGAIRGGQKGGSTPKHYTPDSKARQIAGASNGGKHSHGGHPVI